MIGCGSEYMRLEEVRRGCGVSSVDILTLLRRRKHRNATTSAMATSTLTIGATTIAMFRIISEFDVSLWDLVDDVEPAEAVPEPTP